MHNTGGETRIIITWHIICVSESILNALMARYMFQFQDKRANIWSIVLLTQHLTYP